MNRRSLVVAPNIAPKIDIAKSYRRLKRLRRMVSGEFERRDQIQRPPILRLRPTSSLVSHRSMRACFAYAVPKPFCKVATFATFFLMRPRHQQVANLFPQAQLCAYPMRLPAASRPLFGGALWILILRKHLRVRAALLVTAPIKLGQATL
jgi:hypothetical protein